MMRSCGWWAGVVAGLSLLAPNITAAQLMSTCTPVGPLPLPRAARYAMTVQSAVFMPGMYSLPHHHPGVEALYVLEGEACYETPARAARLQKGETLALPADTPMRAVVTGTARRHVLAVIVHDAAQPATMRMEDGTGPKLAACR